MKYVKAALCMASIIFSIEDAVNDRMADACYNLLWAMFMYFDLKTKWPEPPKTEL